MYSSQEYKLSLCGNCVSYLPYCIQIENRIERPNRKVSCPLASKESLGFSCIHLIAFLTMYVGRNFNAWL